MTTELRAALKELLDAISERDDTRIGRACYNASALLFHAPVDAPAQPVSPMRQCRLTLRLDTDDLEAMSTTLMNLSIQVDRGELTVGVSGSPSSGYVYELLRDPSQTHELYFKQVREYLATTKAAPTALGGDAIEAELRGPLGGKT